MFEPTTLALTAVAIAFFAVFAWGMVAFRTCETVDHDYHRETRS